MPFDIPSLSEIRKLNRDFIAARLPGAEANIPNNPARVLGDADAGLAYQVLLHQVWIALQLLPDTRDGELLDGFWADLVGGRKPASFATGTITVTGLNGTPLPSETQLVAGGVVYETIEQITVGDAATAVSVRALTPGATGNLLEGTSANILTAVSGVDAQATVVNISGGISAESHDNLRDRILARLRQTPQGGSATDYAQWAREVPGVTRAWAKQEAGLGTVTVRFMMDDDRTDGIPNTDDIAAVRAKVEQRRPVAVRDIFVVAPIPFPISFRITNLSRSTNSTYAAIESSVRRMMRQRAEPGGTMWRSWIDEAISRAAGEDRHELLFTTTVPPTPGHIPVYGTMS